MTNAEREEVEKLERERDELREVLEEFPGRSCGEALWNNWLFQKDAALLRKAYKL